jgi:hypothetical protein
MRPDDRAGAGRDGGGPSRRYLVTTCFEAQVDAPSLAEAYTAAAVQVRQGGGKVVRATALVYE